VADQCRSCHAPVIWAISPAGARSPIDPEPVAEGNVLLLKPHALRDWTLAVVLSGDILETARARGPLWVSHWSSCPDKAEWRAKQAAKRQHAAA
jgi:hypothetical protein